MSNPLSGAGVPAGVRRDTISRRVGEVIYRFRVPLTVFILAGAIALAPRVSFTEIDNDITAWFSREDPVFQHYERFRKEFGGTRTLIVALETRDVFGPTELEFLREVTALIERVPLVERAQSLANVNIVRAIQPAASALPRAESRGGRDAGATKGDAGATRRDAGATSQAEGEGGIEVRPLIAPTGEIDAQAVRQDALSDRLIRGDLVSEDGTVAAIFVSFDEDRIDQVRAGTIQRIHDIIDPRLPPGMRSYYNGSLEISETYNRVTLSNTVTFTPWILLFTFSAVYAMFRSLRRTLLTLFAIGISVCWTLGIYDLMGFTYNVLASMIPPLVVVLAVADDVHIIQHYDQALRGLCSAGVPAGGTAGVPAGGTVPAGGDRREAFISTIEHLFVPLLGASGTTALGMLSLATSDIVSVRTFGIGAAVGVMVDFAISLVLVPTALSWLKAEEAPPPQEVWLVAPLLRVARLACRRPGVVGAVALALGAVAAFGITWVRVDTNHVNFFSASHPLHQSADLLDRKLAGIYSFQVLFEGPPDSMKAPETLALMDRYASELVRAGLRPAPTSVESPAPGPTFVRKTTSLADYVRRINRVLNDGRPEADVVPKDASVIAQELFVFSLSAEGRAELDRMVSTDFARAQMSVKLASMSSDLVFEEINRAEALAREMFAGTGIDVTTTGAGRLFSTLDHYLVTSQISSFGTAFVTVFGVIFLIFRSIRFGMLAIVPNLFPVIAVLGLMGWFGITMNVATIMVASFALGVVDDDTIHFISRYRRETSSGAATDDAIATATINEGRASLTTAIINSLSYGVLVFSEYKPSGWFGVLLALTMGVALLAEIFVLPALIKLLPGIYGAEAIRAHRKKGERT